MIRTLVRRDYELARSYRAVFVVDIGFGALSILIYYFVSRTFSGATHGNLQGAANYFSFAIVGVTVTAVMQAAATGAARRIREEQLTGTLEILITQPVSAAEICLGVAGFPFLLATIRSGGYLLVAGGALGVDFSNADWLGFALAMLATGMAITGFGVIVAAVVLVAKRAEILAGLVVLGVALLGGAYFPIGVMPEWLRAIATVIPTRLAFDGLRHALFAGSGWLGPTAVLGGLALVGIPAGLAIFSGALRWTIRRGALTQY